MRLIYKDLLPVDLVPFGALADVNYNICWPPKGEPQMSVIGFVPARQLFAISTQTSETSTQFVRYSNYGTSKKVTLK